MAAIAAVGAGDSAISALNNLASTVMSVYDAVGDRKVGRSDFMFSIMDWASLIRFAEGHLQRALCATPETRARALRVLELNAAVGWWLGGIGFKMNAAEATWSRSPRQRRQLPRFFLAKKAMRFEVKLELVKKEIATLMEELAAADAAGKVGKPLENGQTITPENRIQEISGSDEEKHGAIAALPQTDAVVSRLRFATAKISGEDAIITPGGKHTHSFP